MYKIRKIQFVDHPVLKNLELDFCDANGNPVDTVLFAGENGTGKSAILQALYGIASGHPPYAAKIELIDNQGITHLLTYYDYNLVSKGTQSQNIWVKTNGVNTPPSMSPFTNKYQLAGIYSDVDIVFNGHNITSVTSKALDTEHKSQRSGSDLPQEIKQLIIDIQTQDSNELFREYTSAKEKGLSTDNLVFTRRISRFTNAFSRMFENLEYDGIDNINGHKEIYFKKNGQLIPIDSLSSGEKQVVYRGCFLLKDVNAMNGAFVFIDEPEISLHPTWQMKIMDYYKGIFTNEEGIQTSQIFAVTHSPFVIHNDKRRNDKVIVLARDEQGNVIVKDKPEYYRCDSIEAVQDAFSIQGFSADKPTVYLEGRTDEMYFNKALEVFGMTVPFQFKWVGHMGKKDEEFSGKDSLSKAAQFLIGRNLSIKNVCLFDCDTNREETEINNVYTRVIPTYPATWKMKKGIENALILSGVNVSPFYETKTKVGDYGDDNIIVEFKKMEFCEYICSISDVSLLQSILANLKTEIGRLEKIFEA